MTQAMERREGADAPDVNGPHRSSSNLLIDFWRSAVGKKWVMALSGVGLMGFVFAHMFGNLKMFMGRTAFDAYAEGLRSLLYPIMPHGWVLWAMRIGLIAMFAAHIVSAAQLTAMNRRARPIRYQSPRDYIAANFAARTMRWTGSTGPTRSSSTTRRGTTRGATTRPRFRWGTGSCCGPSG